MKTVFVTVGTTRFDELIESITSPENIQVKKMRFKQNNVLLFFCINSCCFFAVFISLSYILLWPYVLPISTEY